jgi:hypothetical protein
VDINPFHSKSTSLIGPSSGSGNSKENRRRSSHVYFSALPFSIWIRIDPPKFKIPFTFILSPEVAVSQYGKNRHFERGERQSGGKDLER